MVSIFTGSGAGFARGSGSVLGAAGILGSGVQGRSGETVSVNAATGNLLIAQQDEFLVGRGPDVVVGRTYNSLAEAGDGDNGDQWQFSTTRRVLGLAGTLNAAGSTVRRQGGDGSVVTYSWDAGQSAYMATDGDGAHDRLVKSGGTWVWTDGSSRVTETYEASVGDGSVFRIKSLADTDGNEIGYRYTAGTDKLDTVTTANHNNVNPTTGTGEVSYVVYSWSGNNISQIVTGYTDYGSSATEADNVNKQLTRTRYVYDGQNRLVQVTVDLTPGDNSIADGKTYVTTYTYDGSSKRVASITQTDGSSLAIAYDSSGRVSTLTQTVAAGDVRVTRIGYGVNVTSITDATDQVTRLWYDSKKQLVQLMSPPATKGGVSQVLQYEYDASGNLIRTVETDSVNASIPANLVNAAGWGDGEVAGRGENLVDDSGWPQDVDGTLPANGTIGGSAWTSHYVGETEWTVTTGPYGTSVVSMKAGQNDAAGGSGGGAQTQPFDIDPKKAYEFAYYFKLDGPAQHQLYFGAGDIWTGQPGYVENAWDGANNINPYFFSVNAAWQNANLTVGRWYKVVGYVLPEGAANIGATDLGGVYDTTTGNKIADANAFRWSEDRVADKTAIRFFNYYETAIGKVTHFWKPEVREVSDFAILRTGEKLDIVKDRNLIEQPLPTDWQYYDWASNDDEARWSEMLGPDGSWQMGLETGQFDAIDNGGGGYTNNFIVDPTKAYRFTQYVRKSDLSRHNLYFGLNGWGATYVKNAWDGADNNNPYFLSWSPGTQQAYMQEDRWYKVVAYVLPEAAANIGSASLGGVYDAVTGARVSAVNNFRWHENMPDRQIHARFFNYYDQTQHGWSADWLAPEVVEIGDGELAADNLNPFGVTYDESGRISRFTYDANGNLLTSTDANGNVVTRTYGSKNELLTETRTGTHSGAAYVDNLADPNLAQWGNGGVTIAPGGMIGGKPATLFTSAIGATWSGVSQASGNVQAGDQVSFELSLQAVGDVTAQSLGIYGNDSGWGAGGSSTIKILSGPGTVSQDGGALWRISGLSTTQATRVQITRTFTQSESTAAYFYVDYPGGYRDGAQLLAADPKVSVLRGGSTNLTTRYVYDSENHLRYLISPEGRVTEYNYHATGELHTTTEYPEHSYPIGSAAPSEAAMNAWRDAIADKQSIKFSYMLYDARGNMIHDLDLGYMTPGGGTATSEGYSHHYSTYDQAGRLLSRQIATQNSETFLYDGLGRLVGSTDLAGGTTTIVFNDAALTTTVTTASGGVTVSSYNKAGDLVGTTHSGSYDPTAAASYKYDKSGRLRVSTDATGINNYYLYDKAGRKVADITHYGYITEYFYDTAGRVAGTVNYTNVLTAQQVTALGNLDNTIEMAVLRPVAHSYDIWTWSIYDDAGRLIESIDGTGNVAVFSYDGSDRLVKTTSYYNMLSAAQLAALKTSSPTELVLPSSDVRDTVSRSFYDRDGRLIGSLDGEGYLTEIVYDKAGQKVEEIAYAAKTSSGYWSTGTFNELRSTAAPTSSANRRARYVYDGQGLLRFAVDNAGRVTEYVYKSEVEWGAIGLVRSTILHAVSISTGDFTYDNVKALVAANASNAANRTSWSVYDAAGRLSYAIDADGAVTAFTYDVVGQVIKTVAFAAKRATISLPTETTMNSWRDANIGNAANRITRNWYTAAGDLRFIVDPEGYVKRFDYDSEGRTTHEISWANKVVVTDATTIAQIDGLASGAGAYVDLQYLYDFHGRRYIAYDGEGNRTRYTWYANGMLSSVFQSYDTVDQSRTLFVYDGAGRLFQEYSAYGEAEQGYSQYQYDGLGNLLTVTDARGKVTSYTYDERGLVLTMTDAAGGVTSYEYNAFGEVVKTTDPAGGVTYSYYDDLGRVVKVRDAENYVTETSYTAFGEIASVTRRYNRTASAVSTTTPPTVIAHGQDATTTFEYDKRGLVTKTIDAEGWFETYGYDAFGGRTSVTAKSKDANKVAGGTTTYGYDRRGLLTSETLPIASYNNDGGIQSYTVTNSYAYDARGNRIQMVEAAGLAEARTTTYVYDKANRLTETRRDVIRVVPATGLNIVETRVDRISYDARGNMTSMTDGAGARTVYFYDDLDRVVVTINAVGVYTSNVYDANGNVVATRVYDAGMTIPADGGSEEEKPAPPGGIYRETTFTYDNLNRLLTSSVAGVSSYIFNGSSYVLQATNLTSTYEYSATGDVVRSFDANGNATFHYYDRLGNKTASLDAGGYFTAWTYDGEGNVLAERRYATRFTGSPTTVSPPSLSTSGADRLTYYAYDRNGNRTVEQRNDVSIHNGTGGTTTTNSAIVYNYNGLGQVVRKTEATGEFTDYVYDEGGRLNLEVRPIFQLHQGASANPTVEYRYNGLGDLARTTAVGAGDAASRVTRYQYGTGGVLEWVQDASGQTVYHYQDIAGRNPGTLTNHQRADGTTLASRQYSLHDSLGRVTETLSYYYDYTSGAGWDWGVPQRNVYNAYGEVVTTTVNGAMSGENRYDAGGRLIATTAGDGVWKYFGYDANGNQTIAITSAGASLAGLTFAQALALVGQENVNATYTQYDARGQAISVIEEQRRLSAGSVQTLTSTRSYNAFGDVMSETSAAGATTTYAYNNIGRMIRSEGPTVQITLENGATQWVKPSQDYYYDASGRLVATRDANGTYATGGTSGNGTSKDANSGNLTRLTLLAGTGYNGSQALVTAETHADGGVKQTKYDIHGDARVVIDEVNRTTTQVFDGMGRVTQVNQSGGLIDYYAYDGLGQRIKHWNNFLGSGDVETTDYDTLGRVKKTRAFGGDVTTTSYSWDSSIAASGMGFTAGGWTQVTTMANGLTLTEKTDVFGRTTWKSDLGGHVTTYGYDVAGRQISSTMGGLTASFTYYNTGQQATNSGPAGTATYAYDAAGNRTSEVLVDGGATIKNQSATYDAMGRLIVWTEAGTAKSPAASITNAYDANSNIRRTQSSFVYLGSTGAVAYTSGKDYWYRYDSMNRLVVDKGQLSGAAGASGTVIARGYNNNNDTQSGRDIVYDVAGQRVAVLTSSFQAGQWEFYHDPHTLPSPEDPGEYVYHPGAFQELRENYTYDNAGRLTEVRNAYGTQVAENYDPYGGGTGTPSGPVPAAPSSGGYLRGSFTYDLMGRLTLQQDYGAAGGGPGMFTGNVYSRSIAYNAKGQVTSDDVSTVKGRYGTLAYDTFRSVTTYGYGSGSAYALGSVVTQSATNSKLASGSSSWTSQPGTLTTTTYAWYDGAVQDLVTHDYDTGSGSNPIYTTDLLLNAFGQLTGATVNDGVAKSVAYTNDEVGQIIRRDETRTSAPSEAAPHEVFYRFAGRQMGMTGNNGTADMGYVQSVNDRAAARPEPTTSTAGLFRDGTKTGSSAYADFAQSFDPYNSGAQGSAGGTYTARAGDTLQSVAQALWGDANLWYKLAAANGMSGNASLIEGQALLLPTGVQRSGHSAGSMRPYDPTDALGDLSPTTPKPPKKPKCGMLGMILVAAIAIGLSAWLGPQLIGVAANAVTGAAATGLTATLGATGGAIVGGGLAAAAGSIASQAFGLATGIQDKFSWKGVGLSALGGAIGGALGGFNPLGEASSGSIKGIANAAIRGAASNAATQGIGVATGLQSKFDFAGVAAAGIGAGADNFLASRTTGLGKFGSDLTSGMASAIANAATRSAIRGNSFGDNVMAALPDAIGGALGRAAARGVNVAAGPASANNQSVGSAVADEIVVTGSYNLWGLGGARQGLTIGATLEADGASAGSGTVGELDMAATFYNAGPLDPRRALMTWDPMYEELVVTAPIQVKDHVRAWFRPPTQSGGQASSRQVQHWGGVPSLGPVESLKRMGGSVLNGLIVKPALSLAGFARLTWDLNSFDPATRRAAQQRVHGTLDHIRNEGGLFRMAFGAAASATDQLVVYDNPLPALEIGGGAILGGMITKGVGMIGSTKNLGLAVDGAPLRIAKAGDPEFIGPLRPSLLDAAETTAIDVAGGSARLRYMGSTPDKFSRTGREVVDRMRGDGLIVGDGPLLRGNPNNLQLVTEGGQLVRIDSAVDMAHTVDAVTWWNSTGRFYGVKSPEVRQFMLDSNHYILQPSGPNRSAGALLGQTYQPPVPPTFGTLKR